MGTSFLQHPLSRLIRRLPIPPSSCAGRIRGLFAIVCLVSGTLPGFAQNVTTQAYDNSRSGAYPYETVLTPATVTPATFGKLYERAVDGDVQAQPLYVRGVQVPGQGTKDLVFVATAKNKLYAFDADSSDTDPQGGIVWSRQINSSRQLIVQPQSQGGPIEVCNETYNGFVGVTSTPVIDTNTNTMYVVTWRPRMADLNLFVASAQGAVEFSGWLGTTLGYHPWSPLSSSAFVAPGQPITAVWSNASHLDLFTVGADGAVWSAWWEGAKSAQSWQWFRIGQPGDAVPGQPVTAVWSTPQHLDLFVTATDGTVKSTWWEATVGWQAWFAIGHAGNASPGQAVTAVWSTPQHLDLFITAADGTVRSTWWEAAPGWQTWFAIGPAANASPGQLVTAVWSTPQHLDLFITAADGTVKSTWWEAASGWQTWFGIGPAANASPGQPVTAVWSTPQHLDLFTTAADGTVKSTWWEAASAWQTWSGIGPAANASPGQPVTAVWSTPQHIDLFITATDGTVKSTWWEAAPGWQTWFAIGSPRTASPRQAVAALWPKPGHVEDIGGNYLHSIDITTGQEKGLSPVLIQAAAPGSAAILLDPRCHRSRPGLLLLNGSVYVGFSCLSCDSWCSSTQSFHGWVLGYRASDLTQVAVFTTSANAGTAGAGIWQSGSGLAADAQANIYFETGNGEPADPAKAPALDDSFVKLQVTSSVPGLQVAGAFQPANAQALRCGDTDLGSGGPLLLPGGKLIGGGKEGKLYLIDTASMTATQQFQAFSNTWHADSSQPPCPGPHPPLQCNPPFPQDPPGSEATISCYVDPARYQDYQPFGPNIHGAPVVWTLPSEQEAMIYKMPEKDFLKAFRYDLSNFTLSQTPALTATVRPPDGMPGGFSSISSNGSQNGLVWTSFPNGDSTTQSVPGRLVAFDARSLNELWEDDDPVAFSKFTPPTIADGKVYRATFANTLVVYGLLPTPSTTVAAQPAARQAAQGPSAMSPASSCRTISQTYQKYGGEGGILGAPIGDEVVLSGNLPGAYREYRGQIFGAHTSAAVLPAQASGGPESEDMPSFLSRSDLEASIYWSPATCGHVVMGQIRALWISLGAEKSNLGYPISDEIDTPDGRGRRSRFQHGEIWWYPDRGAFIHS
jgi:hypothetical protein